MKVIAKSATYKTPNKDDYFLKIAADLYDNFNKQFFDENPSFPVEYDELICLIYKAFNQKFDFCSKFQLRQFDITSTSNKILLAFSGGLDSAYQALKLREQGNEVILFHVRNMNAYSNGQEYKVAKAFADKFDFKFVEATMTPNHKDLEYKKFWKENPVKNEIFFSMMFDYMIENGVSKFSSGDDLRLDIKEAVPDTNLSDAKQITEAFLKGISNSIKVEFIPITGANKSDRIKYLREHGAEDDYDSCVTAGRLTKYLNKKACEKYEVKLPAWECCACRKCCMHILLRQYYQGYNYPVDLINKCWNVVAVGADKVFFDKALTLEQRVKNLIEY